MKNKEEEKLPLLVHNLVQMHEYPNLHSELHWDILIGTMKMIFNKFPEIDKFLKSKDIEEDKDQKYFNHKLEDLMSITGGKL